ncbi:bifunctional tetrahydrofolate synthase/dihydrofolate synthase [Schauerella aestuarii]|uniref:bifunctional tetrahydrofolate synthase/dihydrofolate synthase n=1 Tax=Schauerella aestuarii TaxID=2511204 RepID=UPI00137064E3|nr:bifunctional tetrahydrofolate synthase/dihydrofolate synthase [Achromobacter aestuarii]MYZ44862.1 bifunctional tetrahydrofolate synthase/dihydrofolate synthase [Achromobacter aestuarii]
MSNPQTPQVSDSLSTWLSYLEHLHSRSIDLGLERVRKVADRLGLASSAVKIVVGGTNGKGSTCAMLEAMLLAAGYKVGVYTSPHLIHFNERARVNGVSASDAALTAAFAEVEQARGDTGLTYFEFTTLAVLRLFAGQQLDAIVLEVGLGGRLDAVNIVDADCAIVTSVDLDHMDWLGDTRELIGFEKAHIFRTGKPAICSDPVPPQTLLDHAAAIGADLWLFGRDFNYSGDRQQWGFGGRNQRRNALAYPALRGANQLLNASAALAALESLRDRLPVPQQAVRVGLSQATLPGRFQILPGQPTIVLDVAHNPHAAAVLAQNLDNMAYFPYTHAVFGMLDDKDVAGVVARMGKRIDHWYCPTLVGPRGVTGQVLADRVAAALPPVGKEDEAATLAAFDDVAAAVAAAQKRAGEGDRIVIFGSFLTVAAALTALGRAH